jgi:hypothetical protein
VNNFHRLGLALFALGIIIFLAQRFALGYFNIIASLFLPKSGITLQYYYATYILSITLLIAGVVMFFKGRRETSLTSAPAER